MKKLNQTGLFASLAILLASTSLHAQTLPDDIEKHAVQTNERRISTNKTGMLVLGGWALANIGVGTAGYLLADDGNEKYFHQMNAGWNIVNLTIATFGFLGQASEDPGRFNWLETIKRVRPCRRSCC